MAIVYIEKSEQAGYHCGNQLFCYVGEHGKTVLLYHALRLKSGAKTAEGYESHCQRISQGKREGGARCHFYTGCNLHGGQKEAVPEK